MFLHPNPCIGLFHTTFIFTSHTILFYFIFIYSESIEILNFWLRMEGSRRDVLAVKSIYGSYRGPGFDFQHPWGGL